MGTKYSKEFKDSITARLLPPHNASVAEVSEETGIPKDTLYGWRSKARNISDGSAGSCGSNIEKFSPEEKLSIIIETASLNEVELGEYCRRKGLFPNQITGWKNAVMQGMSPVPSKADREQKQQQAKEIKQLKSELRRKEKALAEAAALLVLQKKAQALWGEPEED